MIHLDRSIRLLLLCLTALSGAIGVAGEHAVSFGKTNESSGQQVLTVEDIRYGQWTATSCGADGCYYVRHGAVGLLPHSETRSHVVESPGELETLRRSKGKEYRYVVAFLGDNDPKAVQAKHDLRNALSGKSDTGIFVSLDHRQAAEKSVRKHLERAGTIAAVNGPVAVVYKRSDDGVLEVVGVSGRPGEKFNVDNVLKLMSPGVAISGEGEAR